MKCDYNLIYTRESLSGKSNIKFKRSMKLLLKVMAVLYKGLPDLREDSQHGYQMQKGDN